MKLPVSLPVKIPTDLNMAAILGILKNQNSFVLINIRSTHAEKTFFMTSAWRHIATLKEILLY